MCFNMTRRVYIPRCRRLLSIRSISWKCLFPFRSLPHGDSSHTASSSSTMSSSSTCLWKYQLLLPGLGRPVGRSADVLPTSLRIHKQQAHFPSQEVDVNLEQLCCRGHPPRSRESRCTGWWSIFLEESTRKHYAWVHIQTVHSVWV